MGSSSVGPWSTPSATAWRSSSAASGRSIRGATAVAVAPPADREIDGAEDDEHRDRVVDVVQGVLPARPVLRRLLAGEGQREDPRQAAREGEGAELPERHPRDA